MAEKNIGGKVRPHWGQTNKCYGNSGSVQALHISVHQDSAFSSSSLSLNTDFSRHARLSILSHLLSTGGDSVCACLHVWTKKKKKKAIKRLNLLVVTFHVTKWLSSRRIMMVLKNTGCLDLIGWSKVIGSCHDKESQKLLDWRQTWDGLVQREEGWVRGEYHEWSKANDNKVWAPCRLCGQSYTPPFHNADGSNINCGLC